MSSTVHPHPRPSHRRRWLRLTACILTPYLIVISMFAFLQRTLIYVPDRTPALAAEAGFPNSQLREITRVADDGLTLRGWFIAAEGCDAAVPLPANDPHPVVLYFPGNGGHRGYRLKEIRQLTSLGCHVLYFDYRGYADNPGNPTEADLARDARGVWQFATEELRAQSDRIVVWGESLGGGVATGLAHELCCNDQSPGGLILRCTFTSLTDAGVHHYPWLPVRWVLVDRYPSIERIRDITCPILVIHGRQDRIVPFEHGEQLFAAAPATSRNGQPKRLLDLPDAGHNDMMYVAADEIRAAVEEFIESALQVTVDC